MRGPRRRSQRAAIAACAVVLAAVAAVLAAIPAVDRQRAIDLATPYTAKGEPQETPLDDPWCSILYGAALAVCLAMIVRLRRCPDRVALWVVVGAVAVWLLWRESPVSERVIGATSFSWAKYLGNADVPLGLRIVFAAGSMGFTLGLLVYVVRHRRTLVALVREKFLSPGSVLFVLAGLALVTAQMLDKHRSTDKLLGTSLSAWELKDYCEESLEIVGPLLLAMSCVMGILEEPPGARRTPGVPGEPHGNEGPLEAPRSESDG